MVSKNKNNKRFNNKKVASKNDNSSINIKLGKLKAIDPPKNNITFKSDDKKYN